MLVNPKTIEVNCEDSTVTQYELTVYTGLGDHPHAKLRVKRPDDDVVDLTELFNQLPTAVYSMVLSLWVASVNAVGVSKATRADEDFVIRMDLPIKPETVDLLD